MDHFEGEDSVSTLTCICMSVSSLINTHIFFVICLSKTSCLQKRNLSECLFHFKPIAFSFRALQLCHCRWYFTMRKDDIPCCQPTFWMFVVICSVLLLFASITSGLALGLLSFSQVDLEVLIKAGKPQAKKNAGCFLVVTTFSNNQ